MNAERHSYVLNLPEWELPRLDDLEFALVEELAATARSKKINSETLEDAFSELLRKRLLTLVQSAVNESIICPKSGCSLSLTRFLEHGKPRVNRWFLGRISNGCVQNGAVHYPAR